MRKAAQFILGVNSMLFESIVVVILLVAIALAAVRNAGTGGRLFWFTFQASGRKAASQQTLGAILKHTRKHKIRTHVWIYTRL